MFRRLLCLSAFLLLTLSSASRAAGLDRCSGGEPRNTLLVSATIATSCAFSMNAGGPSAAANGFNFGDITSRGGTVVSSTASLTYVCNAVNAPRIALNDANGSSTIGFQLKNTTSAAQNLLPFTIVQTTGVTPFTDSNVAFQTVLSNPISLTASLVVPATLPAGVYSDTITATLLP